MKVGKIDFELKFTKKSFIIIAAVTIIIIALEFVMIRGLRSYSTRVNGAVDSSKSLESALQSRTETVMKYKQALRFDYSMIPGKVSDPAQTYAMLMSILGASHLDNANVSRVDDKDDMVSFKVSGNGNYYSILDFLAELRRSSYLIRLRQLNVSGGQKGASSYEMVVQAEVSSPDIAPQTAGGGK